MTKQQAQQMFDWLTTNGCPATVEGRPDPSGVVSYVVTATVAGDSTTTGSAKLRTLFTQVEARGLYAEATGLVVRDPPAAPPPVA